MEDETIIGLYLKRDEEAIHASSLKYGALLKSVAYRILNNSADAEECENDAYFAAWNAIPPAQPKSLAAFLGRIVRNHALNRYDYYTADKRNRAFDLILSELSECIPARDTAEGSLEEGETAEHINRFLKHADSAKRAVFVRRYWYSDTIKDIALRYHFSESKVKSMLMRTRSGLKKYLDKEGVTL